MSDPYKAAIETNEDSQSDPAIQYGRRKFRIVVLLLAYSVICGILSCFLPEEDTPLDFIVGLPFLILGVSWCFTDAAERDHRIGMLTKLLLIFFFIFGFPIYLLQTRGLGAFKTLAFSILLVVAMLVILFGTAFTTLVVGELTGFWQIEY